MLLLAAAVMSRTYVAANPFSANKRSAASSSRSRVWAPNSAWERLCWTVEAVTSGIPAPSERIKRPYEMSIHW